MENNIFFKNKKDKFNPDVVSTYSKSNITRKKTDFKDSKVVYNAITHEQVPEKIKNAKDLQLKKDLPMDNTKRALAQKMDERNKQETDLKPQKMKSLPQNLIVDKKIENFEELKKSSDIHIKKTQQEFEKQKHKYDDILSNLKNMGMLK
jgi:hypothetical protein